MEVRVELRIQRILALRRSAVGQRRGLLLEIPLETAQHGAEGVHLGVADLRGLARLELGPLLEELEQEERVGGRGGGGRGGNPASATGGAGSVDDETDHLLPGMWVGHELGKAAEAWKGRYE